MAPSMVLTWGVLHMRPRQRIPGMCFYELVMDRVQQGTAMSMI